MGLFNYFSILRYNFIRTSVVPGDIPNLSCGKVAPSDVWHTFAYQIKSLKISIENFDFIQI